jgi:hypothetical protein
MPKVVTTVNLDFDEKEEFIKRFGKDALSQFLREAIHEALEEKNREAHINLSAIHTCLRNDIETKPNKSLDGWIEYIKKQERPEPLIEIMPKLRLLYQLNDGRIKGMQHSGIGGRYSVRSL